MISKDDTAGDISETLPLVVVKAMVEDARARGYAEGRNEGQVRLALMSDETRMLPGALVDAYGTLCVGALSDGMEGNGIVRDLRAKPKTTRSRTSTGQTETRGLAKASKSPVPRGGADVRSIRLMAAKSRVDRKLRSIAREIEKELEGGGKGDVRKCTRCGKFAEDTWNYCPWDGAPTQSEDPKSGR